MPTYQENQSILILALILISLLLHPQEIHGLESRKITLLRKASHAVAPIANWPQRCDGVSPVASAPEGSVGLAPVPSAPVGGAPIASTSEGSIGFPLNIENCTTGNPIDDCWRCSDSPWQQDRKRLAECALGLRMYSIGGREGSCYVVDSDDDDPEDPNLGTLRHAVTQDEPLWIIFMQDMVIHLKDELVVKSFKTIDGRGADIHITGHGCITIKHVADVIIHGIHVHDCKATGGTGGRTHGDGISILGARDVWVDHCSLSNCYDGLIDVTHNSTAITISNNLFTHHNKVMLLGHDDNDTTERNLRVTIAYNHFGEGLVQRMPRCRHGYFHVMNNYYSGWGLYAIGGSANPTILSQGNVYLAPQDSSHKEVTSRICGSKEWKNWNWESHGDAFLNGAFFISSGPIGLTENKQKWNLATKPASEVHAITRNAGVLRLQSS